MTECANVDGVWGSPCPGCGQMLPNPPPIQSWMSHRVKGDAWASKGLANKPAPRRFHLADRQDEVLAVVARHGGNRSAAARALGCPTSSINYILLRARRAGVAVPPPSMRRATA